MSADELAPAPFGSVRQEGDYLVGQVLEADRFGSIRLSITAEDVEARGITGREVEIDIGHIHLSVPLGTTFADVDQGDLIVLVDSSGWLTLAENTGSAYERFGVDPGTHVRVRSVG